MLNNLEEFYLHWWNEEKQCFSEEQTEVKSNFGGIILPGEFLINAYPGGYKYWLRRKIADAPEWVLEYYRKKS